MILIPQNTIFGWKSRYFGYRQDDILNTLTKSKKSVRDLAHNRKVEEHEKWHNILLKVIIWRDGTSGKGVVREVKRITAREWRTYRKSVTSVNIASGKDKVKARLRDTWQKIKSNGGFL